MSFEVSASGLTAERLRMNIIAENIANANTTHPTPYRRKKVVFEERLGAELGALGSTGIGGPPDGGGVRVAEVTADSGPTAFLKVYDPSHPDADKEGYVLRPNINVVQEMVDLIDASRAYEANLSALKSAEQMVQKTLTIGQSA